MIATVMKHEHARTGSQIWGLWGLTSAVALVTALSTLPQWPVISDIAPMLVGLCGVLNLGVAIFLAIEHWYTSFGPGGYLTQMLPVRGSTLFAGKFCYALLMTLGSIVVSLVWVFVSAVLSARSMGLPWSQAWESVVGGLAKLNPMFYWVGVPLILLVFLSYLAQFYFAAAVGSEGRLAGRPWGPFVVYLLAYLVLQILMVIAILAIPYGVDLSSPALEIQSANYWAALTQGASVSGDVMPVGFIPVAVLAFIPLVWRTAWSWNHKVSLR